MQHSPFLLGNGAGYSNCVVVHGSRSRCLPDSSSPPPPHTHTPCAHIQVALGEAVCSSISPYLAQQEAAGGPACQVITVSEDSGTADALRLVAPHLTAPSVIVYSGDCVTDLHLPAVMLQHQVCGGKDLPVYA